MLDSTMRRLIDPPLNAVAGAFPDKISANSITIGGFFIGLGCFHAILQGNFTIAFVLLAANRVADGLDGAVARRTGATDLGAYLDIVSDFLLWALLPVAFIFHDTDNAFAAAMLLSSFAMSMTGFLAFAIQAEKRGQTSETQGKKGFYYLAGLAEGTETIAFFSFVLLYPAYFAQTALVFAAFVFLSVIGRLIVSINTLRGA